MVLQQDEANLSKCLSEGENPNVPLNDGSTPIHTAAAEGSIRCLKLLLEKGGDLSIADNVGRTPLYSAAYHGHLDCIQLLLDYGSSITAQTQAGWTAIHAAIQNDHVDCLVFLLSWRRKGFLFEENSPNPSAERRDSSVAENCGMPDNLAQHVFPNPDANTLPEKTLLKTKLCTLPELLALRDQDGWTPVHLAASKELPTCLHLLLANCQNIDFKSQDKWGKTVFDVASPSCRELLESLSPNIIFCCIYLQWTKAFEAKFSYQQIGIVNVHKQTTWSDLEKIITLSFLKHLSTITTDFCKNDKRTISKKEHNPLNLGIDSIACFCIGEEEWIPGQSNFTNAPYDTLMNNEIFSLVIRLKDGNKNSVHATAYNLLLPVTTVQNYLRLLEQYKSVVFYGPIGSGKSSLAYHLGHLLQKKQKDKQKWNVFQLNVATEEPEKLLDKLRSIGCLCSTSESISSLNAIVILDHLTPEITTKHLANILPLLDTRGDSQTVAVTFSDGQTRKCYIPEKCFIIATVNRFRSLGFSLVAQQRCRWVHLKPDGEPCRSLLNYHLMRHLLPDRMQALSTIKASLDWLQLVWQRTNQTLGKLGLVELAFGPLVFLPTKKDLRNSSQLLRFISNVWNTIIVPAVEQTMIDSIRPFSEQHVRRVDAALIVLIQKAVVPDCPVALQERETYFPTFRGCTNSRLFTRNIRFSWSSYSQQSEVDSSSTKILKRLSDPTEKLAITCNNLLKLPSSTDGPKDVTEDVNKSTVVKDAASKNIKKESVKKIPSALSNHHPSMTSPCSTATTTTPTATGNKRPKAGTPGTTNRTPQRKTNFLRVKKVVSPVTPRSFSFLTSASPKDKKVEIPPALATAKSSKEKK